MPRKTLPDVLRDWADAEASMRPRPDAAENGRRQRVGKSSWLGFNEAAARCRGKRGRSTTAACTSVSFNEAAARCRGKRRNGPYDALRPGRASMRPRPDAAENCRALSAALPAASALQ